MHTSPIRRAKIGKNQYLIPPAEAKVCHCGDGTIGYARDATKILVEKANSIFHRKGPHSHAQKWIPTLKAANNATGNAQKELDERPPRVRLPSNAAPNTCLTRISRRSVGEAPRTASIRTGLQVMSSVPT